MEAYIINPNDIISFKEIPYETTYDITVKDNHNFYLATEGDPILVHNSGKSEFMDEIMTRLSERHKWKFGVFSAENQPVEFHFVKLAERYIGKSFSSTNEDYKMTVDELGQAKLFVNDNFFFISLDNNNLTIDGILAKAKELVERKGINALLIDPYNYIEHKIPVGYNETQYISELLTKIKMFKERYNIHIFLIAHPVKLKKENGKWEVPTLYHISGSSHFYNKTDNGFVVWRDFETGEVQVHVQKVRFKFVGKQGATSFTYNKFNGRYQPYNDYAQVVEEPQEPTKGDQWYKELENKSVQLGIESINGIEDTQEDVPF